MDKVSSSDQPEDPAVGENDTGATPPDEEYLNKRLWWFRKTITRPRGSKNRGAGNAEH